MSANTERGRLAKLLPGLPLTKYQRRQYQISIEIEKATLKIVAVLNPQDVDAAMVEAKRREDLFALVKIRSPHGAENHRLAALESVARDAAQGWLG